MNSTLGKYIFYTKLLKTVLKVNNSILIWVQNGCEGTLFTFMALWLTGSHACCCGPASQESIVPHVASLGKKITT